MGFKKLLSLACLLILHSISSTSAKLETYIVHVESPDEFEQLSSTTSSEDLEKWYHSFLPTSTASFSVSSSDTEEPRIVHSYHHVFKGFAARLSPEHVKAMETKPGFVSARPEKVFHLHTTHSPNFLGLNQNSGLWKKTNFGKGMIIAVLDTGVVPEHPSFSDKGMPPPPAKWKGKCHFKASLCNKKLIGAVDLIQDNGIPIIDENGHGTHTASTAAGNFIFGANVFGNANGTAAGVAPLAHLAIYKVCDSTGSCAESNTAAGIDAAIGDGVDIISASIEGESGPFYEDPSEISAFSAMRRGIFVSRCAGNSGPENFTAENVSPWTLTVGASTIDRKVQVTAVLGNKKKLQGESLYQPKTFRSRPYPLFFQGLPDPDINQYCYDKLVKVKEVKGKIVVCAVGGIIDDVEKGKNVKAAGGVGMIIVNLQGMGFTVAASPHVIPATHVSNADGLTLLDYVNSTSSPTASLSFQGTLFGDAHAPEVALFSSRGPNNASRGILKPDIIGPGVNILAGWHKSVENKVNTKANFNVISGTSMSCPHLSGVAALLKSAHPDWSPAAIKSAIMTTAYTVNLGKHPIEDQEHLPANVFAMGSGHVNPVRADNPGLIYDIAPNDYIPYLCGLNYTDKEVKMIVQRKVKCTTSIPEAQLNYPSFAIEFGEKVQKYTRKVTNVGEPKSVYTVNVVPPPGVKVTVKPQKLGFSKLNQKLTYEVTFALQEFPRDTSVLQGSISWMSEKHSVRSPIAATKKST